MADSFKTADMKLLLREKRIIFLGDSNVRALYKDFLWLYQNNSLIKNSALIRRLEFSCFGDKLIRRSDLTKGRDFMEHRHFVRNDIEIEFLFITRCINDQIVEMMNDFKEGRKKAPNVIIMGSVLWDLTRWGPNGPADYRTNLVKLMMLLKSSLPKHTLVIWTTAPPTASKITGGLIIKQIEFMQEILRFEILAANRFAASVVPDYGYDVIDFYYYLQAQIFRRSCDGVHYLPLPVRFMTNLILTHISISWDHPLPSIETYSLLESLFVKFEESGSTLNKLEIVADNLIPKTPNIKENVGAAKSRLFSNKFIQRQNKRHKKNNNINNNVYKNMRSNRRRNRSRSTFPYNYC